jgi:hypothetical protein
MHIGFISAASLGFRYLLQVCYGLSSSDNFVGWRCKSTALMSNLKFSLV